MREFWRHFRGRRSNPVYMHQGRWRWRGLFGWKNVAYLVACLIFVSFPEMIGDRNGTVYPLSFLLLVPLSFYLFLPRRLQPAYLEELSLTRLTAGEIGFGVMLPALAKSFVPLLLYCVVLASTMIRWNDLTMRRHWSWDDFILIACLVALCFHLMLLMGGLRFFSARVGRRGMPFALTSMYGVALVPLLGLGTVFAAMGLGQFVKPTPLWSFVLLFSGLGLLTLRVCRTSLFFFPIRMMECVEFDRVRHMTWHGNEQASEEEKERRSRSFFRLMGFALQPARILVPIALFLFTMTMAYAVFQVATDSSTVKEGLWGAIIFSQTFMMGTVIVMTVGYLVFVRRGVQGKLPLIAGGLRRTLFAYSLVSAVLALLYLAGSFLYLYLSYNRLRDEDLFFRLFAAPCVVFLVLTVVGTMLAGRRSRPTIFLWLVVAGGCFLATQEILMEAGQGYWKAARAEFINFDPVSITSVMPLFLSVYVIYMPIIGFTRLLQKLHERHVGDVPRGELTEPLQ